ncbi:MAG: branched-chain amino acid ABC transporter permease [Hyphomicrobiales bacterium]|nr:branched-chain amino acid ABC transporter permease [Hyphomicrobiales bacterium]
MSAAESQTLDAGAALPQQKTDYVPILLPFALALVAYPFVGSFSTWLTLTLAGLAMGMMIFAMASGLTLVFGLMDVMNFGHGAFISVGAYLAMVAIAPMAGYAHTDALGPGLLALLPAIALAMIGSAAAGYVFERVLVRPVYGQHLKQILITMGGLIVTEQVLYAAFGPQINPLPRPEALHGSIDFAGAAIEKYRLFVVIVGLVVFALLQFLLTQTKIGLLIRAGVENKEMVEALGYRIRRLFVGVFMAGSALAGLGGLLWAFNQEQAHASMGGEMMVLTFIVIIIGGLGSVGGCFIGAVLVALLNNYTAFLLPKAALVSTILLMVVVLLWRPRGLYAVTSR